MAAEKNNVSGSCLCGSVRYEIDGGFALMGNCHCSMCRKSNGAAFVGWGILNSDTFRWVAGEDNVTSFESSPGMERCFCKNCGSALITRHHGKPGEVVLGSVDGDPGGRPDSHIFVGSKACWHEITDEFPQFEGWPPGMEPA